MAIGEGWGHNSGTVLYWNTWEKTLKFKIVQIKDHTYFGGGGEYKKKLLKYGGIRKSSPDHRGRVSRIDFETSSCCVDSSSALWNWVGVIISG